MLSVTESNIISDIYFSLCLLIVQQLLCFFSRAFYNTVFALCLYLQSVYICNLFAFQYYIVFFQFVKSNSFR